jgi:hypothetical protein
VNSRESLLPVSKTILHSGLLKTYNSNGLIERENANGEYLAYADNQVSQKEQLHLTIHPLVHSCGVDIWFVLPSSNSGLLPLRLQYQERGHSDSNAAQDDGAQVSKVPVATQRDTPKLAAAPWSRLVVIIGQ